MPQKEKMNLTQISAASLTLSARPWKYSGGAGGAQDGWRNFPLSWAHDFCNCWEVTHVGMHEVETVSANFLLQEVCSLDPVHRLNAGISEAVGWTFLRVRVCSPSTRSWERKRLRDRCILASMGKATFYSEAGSIHNHFRSMPPLVAERLWCQV